MTAIRFMQTRSPVLLTALAVVPCVWVILYCLRFYWQYSGQGWFFQDDFFFIHDYEHQLKPSQWFSADNFGRFLSRNVYWWGLLNTFGRDAQAFFLFNLAVVLGTAGLLTAFVWPVSRWAACLTGAAYVTAGPTVANFSWLSNSQHLLAHFFLAAYLLLVQRSWQRQSSIGVLCSAPVFVLALSSNVLSAVALSYPVLLLLHKPRGEGCRVMWATLVFNVFCALGFVWVLRPAQSGYYATSLSWEVVSRNMGYYYGHAAVFLALTAMLVAAGWYRLKAGHPQEAWVLVAGPVFIIPFLPLVHQHYLNYAALSHVFILVGVFMLAAFKLPKRWRYWVWGLVVVLGAFFVRSAAAQIKNFRHEQRGADQRAQVEALQNYFRQGKIMPGTVICFSRTGESHHADSPMPGYWWGVAFGDAFQVFVSEKNQYVLRGATNQCALDARIDGPRLSLGDPF